MARRKFRNPFSEIRRFKDRKEIHIHTGNYRHDISFESATMLALDLLRMVYGQDNLITVSYDPYGGRKETKFEDVIKNDQAKV